MTEAEFLAQVLDLARLLGWRTLHLRPARTARGWRTAVAGEGKGFFDLILVRERVVFVELKSEKGRLTIEQQGWLEAMKKAGQEVYIWRPSTWSEIVNVLK